MACDVFKIFAPGPAINIAPAMDKEPETKKQVKMIWSMGSAGLGHGNASPVAEFNVYADTQDRKENTLRRKLVVLL